MPASALRARRYAPGRAAPRGGAAHARNRHGPARDHGGPARRRREPSRYARDGILPRTRQLVQRLKTSAGYTEAIGKDLGVVATASADTATPKPTFRATVLPHHEVRLDWVKGRHSGVLIQSKRNDDKDWVTLGTDNYSPYVDGRDLVTAGASETRQYRMRYLDKDDEVGEWSDIVSAVAAP